MLRTTASPSMPRLATPAMLRAVAIGGLTAALVVALAKPRVLDRPLADARAALLQHAAADRERAAAMLAAQLARPQAALAGVAARIAPELLADPRATGRLLLEQTELISQFSTLFALGPDGKMVARVAAVHRPRDRP